MASASARWRVAFASWRVAACASSADLVLLELLGRLLQLGLLEFQLGRLLL
jgi:hypothetical protein